MRIYLDLCTIQRPADDQSQLRVYLETKAVVGILKLVESGAIELVSSTVLQVEHAQNPHLVRRAVTEKVLRCARLVVPIDIEVEGRAERYRELGLQDMDAAHLACAVQAGVDFFCTCDDQLLRRARRIDTGLTRAVTPLELMEEVK